MIDDAPNAKVAADTISYSLRTETPCRQGRFIAEIEHRYWSGPLVGSKWQLRAKLRRFQRMNLISYGDRIHVSSALAHYPADGPTA